MHGSHQGQRLKESYVGVLELKVRISCHEGHFSSVENLRLREVENGSTVLESGLQYPTAAPKMFDSQKPRSDAWTLIPDGWVDGSEGAFGFYYLH